MILVWHFRHKKCLSQTFYPNNAPPCFEKKNEIKYE